MIKFNLKLKLQKKEEFESDSLFESDYHRFKIQKSDFQNCCLVTVINFKISIYFGSLITTKNYIADLLQI